MQGNMQKNAQTLAYSVFFSYLCRNFFAHCRRVDFSGKEIAPRAKTLQKVPFCYYFVTEEEFARGY